ncbi:MAG: flavin reductase family protein [Clostridia bacterium]|nr:flavin reductase family protein [Clostridia bacterium]
MENKKKISLNPGTLLGPLPAALVSLGTMDKSNIITVAWTGIINSKPPMTYISVRLERYSHRLLLEKGEFVINLPSSDLTRRVDLCGMKTGTKGDKFKICGFNKLPAEKLEDCPVIAECPVNIECRVTEVKHLGSHDMFMAEIVGVTVDGEFVDENGKADLRKAGLISYLHGEYFAVGRKLGEFGFSVRKKKQ